MFDNRLPHAVEFMSQVSQDWTKGTMQMYWERGSVLCHAAALLFRDDWQNDAQIERLLDCVCDQMDGCLLGLLRVVTYGMNPMNAYFEVFRGEVAGR